MSKHKAQKAHKAGRSAVNSLPIAAELRLTENDFYKLEEMVHDTKVRNRKIINQPVRAELWYQSSAGVYQGITYVEIEELHSKLATIATLLRGGGAARPNTNDTRINNKG